MVSQSCWAAIAAVLAVALTEMGPVKAADWTGAYVGAQTGASRADINTQQFGDFDTTRAVFGGHVGYNLGLGMLVVGVEGDGNYANSSINIATAGGGALKIASIWSGSVRGRAGVTVGPALFYATAGWGWTGVSTLERTVGGTSLKSSGTFDGVVYGLGAEAYLLPPLSLRFEVLRYDYGSDHVSVVGGVASLLSLDRGDTVVRAGITVHFK